MPFSFTICWFLKVLSGDLSFCHFSAANLYGDFFLDLGLSTIYSQDMIRPSSSAIPILVSCTPILSVRSISISRFFGPLSVKVLTCPCDSALMVIKWVFMGVITPPTLDADFYLFRYGWGTFLILKALMFLVDLGDVRVYA